MSQWSTPVHTQVLTACCAHIYGTYSSVDFRLHLKLMHFWTCYKFTQRQTCSGIHGAFVWSCSGSSLGFMAVRVCESLWESSFKSEEVLHEIKLLDPRGWKEQWSLLAQSCFNSNHHENTHFNLRTESIFGTCTHPISQKKSLLDPNPWLKKQRTSTVSFKHFIFTAEQTSGLALEDLSTISYSPLANFDFISSISFNWLAALRRN